MPQGWARWPMGSGLRSPDLQAGDRSTEPRRPEERSWQRFPRKAWSHFHRALCINLHGREYSLHVGFQRLQFQGDQNARHDSGLECACLQDLGWEWAGRGCNRSVLSSSPVTGCPGRWEFKPAKSHESQAPTPAVPMLQPVGSMSQDCQLHWLVTY